MGKMQKLLAICWTVLVLAGLCLITVFPVSAAETSGTCGENVVWSFDESTGALTITGSGPMASWGVDDRAPWFALRNRIKTVTVSDGVTTISDNAFMNCEELTKAVLPDSILEIGDQAFYWCIKLSDFTIPANVRQIGCDAFHSCRSLRKIEIPASVQSISFMTFKDCCAAEEITIAEGVKGVDTAAFDGCIKLKELYIPSSVEYISQPVGYCTSLVSITVSPENPRYYSAGNCIISRADNAVIAGCKTSVLPVDGSVKIIGHGAFSRHQLTSIVIPNGVTKIKGEAFYACRKLESITIPRSVTEIGFMAFDFCENLTIYGYTGTRAESYARENNINFVPLCSEHSYGAWQDNGNGTHTRICANCQEVETQEHNYSAWVNNGSEHIQTCADCGARKTQGHQYGQWREQNDATHGRSCSVCGKIETQSHNFGNYMDVDEEKHVRNCQECGKEDKCDHAWDSGTIWSPPTENMTGIRVYKCVGCGREKLEEIPKLDHNHNYDSQWKQDASNHWKECYCGDKGEIGGHRYDAGVLLQDATCQQEGKVLYTCQVCKYEKTETASGNHEPGEWETTIAPTCVKTGLQEQKCLICGESIGEQTIPAMGHTFGDWVVTKEPTETEMGEEERICHCGATERRALEKTNSEPTQPTETQPVATENQSVNTQPEPETPASQDLIWIVSVVLLLGIAIVIVIVISKKRKKEEE